MKGKIISVGRFSMIVEFVKEIKDGKSWMGKEIDLGGE